MLRSVSQASITVSSICSRRSGPYVASSRSTTGIRSSRGRSHLLLRRVRTRRAEPAGATVMPPPAAAPAPVGSSRKGLIRTKPVQASIHRAASASLALGPAAYVPGHIGQISCLTGSPRGCDPKCEGAASRPCAVLMHSDPAALAYPRGRGPLTFPPILGSACRRRGPRDRIRRGRSPLLALRTMRVARPLRGRVTGAGLSADRRRGRIVRVHGAGLSLAQRDRRSRR